MDLSTIVVIIAQILGLISWILLLISYTKEDIDDLLLIQIFVAFFDVASYLLLGADAGLLICLVELVKTILYYKTDKDDLIFRIGVICYALIGILTVRHWYAILPVLGSLVDSYGTSKDSVKANIASIVSNLLWTWYDLIILSYIGAFNDIVVVICNISVLLLGYSRIMRINKFRIVKYLYLNKQDLEDIYNLDAKNYGKENLWDKEYQLAVYKRNNDSFFAIKYKHDFVGYINYLNIIPEEYDRIKRLRTMPDKIDLNTIIQFKRNKKSYILMESINVKKEYEKEQTSELINKKIKSFMNLKKNRKIYIHGILAYGLTDFEKDTYKYLGFKKIKELKDNIDLYELDADAIKEYLSK